MKSDLTKPAASTVWASPRAEGAAWLLDQMASCGVDSLELEYRITTPIMNSLRRELGPAGFTVCSVHNFCPLPPGLDRGRASGDLFNLASLDAEERALAVRYTLATMELASDLRAPAVVLHLGWVADAWDKELMKTGPGRPAMDPGPEMAAHLAQRERSAAPHLDAVSFSLEKLLARAEPLGVRLGMENRYHAFEIPTLAEAEMLNERFRGGALGHWHDVGHAFVQERAGLEGSAQWLERLGDALVGCHLHDAKGAGDHLPPGEGEMDWPGLTAKLVHAPIKVLEIKAGPDAGAISRAAGMITGLFEQALKGQAGEEGKTGQ